MPFYPTVQEPSVREVVRELNAIQPVQQQPEIQNRDVANARTFTAPRIPREAVDKSDDESIDTTNQPTAKRRGRPPGSKNKTRLAPVFEHTSPFSNVDRLGTSKEKRFGYDGE
jgi:hypothetical protein